MKENIVNDISYKYAIQKEIDEIETELVDVRKQMDGYLKELGI